MRLTDTVAMVTGGSSGIGAATAQALASAGARLLLVGRDKERLAAVADRTGATAIVADLSTPDGCAATAKRALHAAGRVDILVNNAGIGWAGRFASMDGGDIERLVAINLTAPLRLTRLLIPAMVERGSGHVVHVSSIAGCTGVRDEAVYAATKGGLHLFADSLRQEVAGSGVGVSIVVPGVVDTPFFDRRGTPYDRRWPRPIPPERVAGAIVDAVAHERAEAYVPGWTRMPARLHGGLPGLFRTLATRFG
ncbi:MAG: SDR family NAD(P)-dependent oxidoreductase [Streptosporangiaceae bacterium]